MKTWNMLVIVVIFFTSAPAWAELYEITGYHKGETVLVGEPKNQVKLFVEKVNDEVRRLGAACEVSVTVVGVKGHKTTTEDARYRAEQIVAYLKIHLPDAKVNGQVDGGLPHDGVRFEYVIEPLFPSQDKHDHVFLIIMLVLAVALSVFLWLLYRPREEWLFVKGYTVRVRRRGRFWYSDFKNLNNGTPVHRRMLFDLQKILGNCMSDDSLFRNQRDELLEKKFILPPHQAYARQQQLKKREEGSR